MNIYMLRLALIIPALVVGIIALGTVHTGSKHIQAAFELIGASSASNTLDKRG